MKFSEYWLREWVNPPLSTKELVQHLTMAGLEVESITPVAPFFDKVIVGEIVSIAKHPEADNLTICQVNEGRSTLNIVCGANNVQVGMRVPTALIGAKLPGVQVKKTKLRGISSEGMLCSAQELGLADTSDGIMSLPQELPLGQDFRHLLHLDDVCIEIALTPNRGDCLSIAGIAREIATLTSSPIKASAYAPVVASISDQFPIEVLHTQACPHYVGRIIKHINPLSSTPFWMQERLRRSGLRSIHPVVDVTNYVLLELGQPLHAFDLSHLTGGIQVRMAKEGESLTLLDGRTLSLDQQTLVIADHRQALALAGIMGGLNSGVTSITTDILLESAFFSPQTLAGCARKYGLQTDASYRFERGVDPFLQQQAIERATELLLQIVGGQAAPIVEVSDPTTLPHSPSITLRHSRIQKLLGYPLDPIQVEKILTSLKMDVEECDQHTWQVSPPSFRFDLNIEHDLIEELARVYGYNHLPSHPPHSKLLMSARDELPSDQLQTVLVQRGYQEAITYSFVDPLLQAKINPHIESISLANPIASDMSVMRTTLWTGLIQALCYNQKRQQSRVRLFEIGLRFIWSKEQGVQQEKVIAGLASGSCFPEQWGVKTSPMDFFDLKSDIEALLNLQKTEKIYPFKPDIHPALHPGQTAAIYHGQEQIGLCGALHPNLVQILEVTPPVYLFELKLAPLVQYYLPKFKEVSKYPSIRRDLAMVVAESISVTQLFDCIRQNATDLLVELCLFDVYRNEKLEQGKKSVAIGLIFQAFSRNLIESEIEIIIGQIVNILEQQLGAQLRK